MGILVVNGGSEPESEKWLDFCLAKIKKHTRWPNYTIYIWNNNFTDPTVTQRVKKIRAARLINTTDPKELAHIHAVPLQKLYEVARKDGVKYIVTMDTDAFPVRDNWLKFLVERLDEQTVIAGVWRDELKKGIDPYIHPSCLCTTVDYIEKHNIRLDLIDHKAEKKIDTLSHLSDIAVQHNKKLFKLTRSNVNQLHFIMGGLYGDLIYHHAAGSRKSITFWGEERTQFLGIKNIIINRTLRNLVFHHDRQLIYWLKGKSRNGSAIWETPDPLFILGIHQDAVNCLVQSLGLNKSIHRGDTPQKEMKGTPLYIAFYTYPLVFPDIPPGPTKARLTSTHQWNTYYSSVLKLHRKLYFPIVKFDIGNPDDSVKQVVQLAIDLGLDPNLKKITGNIYQLVEKVEKDNVTNVPAECSQTFGYLEENRLQSLPGTFAYEILKLKKELWELEDKEQTDA